MKAQIIESFSPVSASLRIVCATVAFGMGGDTPDVRQVIHFGPLMICIRTFRRLAEEGRDGKVTVAKLLSVRKFNPYCNKGMLSYIKMPQRCTFSRYGQLYSC